MAKNTFLIIKIHSLRKHYALSRALVSIMLLLCCTQLLAADELAAVKLDNQERIKRLQDITINSDGWYMNIPDIQSGSSRSGLQTAGYSVLQKDMLDVMRELAANPDNKSALNRLQLIQDRVESRILANLDAGYLYAADVYIDMLQDIVPESDKVADYRQHIADFRAFDQLSLKFDQALADSRLHVPEDDCASYYLAQMLRLRYADADKIAEVKSRLRASQQLARNG
mgnify:CR=1 FL=1